MRRGNFSQQNSDLLISIGARLDYGQTAFNHSNFAKKAKKIIIDIDQSEIDKENGLVVDLPINSNLNTFFDQVLQEDLSIRDISEWKNRIDIWKVKYPICLPEYFNEKGFVNPYRVL